MIAAGIERESLFAWSSPFMTPKLLYLSIQHANRCFEHLIRRPLKKHRYGPNQLDIRLLGRGIDFLLGCQVGGEKVDL